MAVTFFFLVFLESKPSYPVGKKLSHGHSTVPVCIDFIVLLFSLVISGNSFIYLIPDIGESLKDYINVVPNFSYKKTEIHPVSLALFFRVWSVH